MKLRWAIIIALYLFSSVTCVSSVLAATVWTDEPEYLKGDTAQIFGVGFTPYSPIQIKVTRPDGSIVTGNGTETPGSDTVITNVDGNFAYSYSIDGIQAEGIYTVEAIDTAPDPDLILATTTFLDKAQFLLQGCSWTKGDCTPAPLPAWADGPTPMDGWTSGVLKGWAELDDVSYRLRINLPKPGDAGTYYITNEHDNLRSGVTGVDDMTEFYVGKMDDGNLTKTCTFQATRTILDNPTSLNPCIITGHTYTGQNDDPLNDLIIDEETTDGLDDDLDSLVDEDPSGSSVPARRIQDTWAVLFDSSEAGGSNKKWALYWKAHLALGSSGFPGASLHANTTATGAQDVPIKNIQPSPPPPPPPADLYIQKDYSGIVNPGKTLSFTLEYGNTGGSDAVAVVITDDYDEDYLNPIPGSICCGGIDDGDKITWSAGTVTAGSGLFVLTYDGKIHDNTPDTNAHMPVGDTHVVNTATISTSSVDGDLSDNIWTVDIFVHAEPNLFVTKTVNSNSLENVVIGDTVSIKLIYGNSDNNDAPNTLLCDDYNQAYLTPNAGTITPGGVDDGDKICWGLIADSLPGVIPGTRTLPGIDPEVSYDALVIDNPVDWTDTATITTSDPEPPLSLSNNVSSVQFLISMPTAIRLSSFEALSTESGIIISWATGAEIDSEGFYLWRSSSPSGPFSNITPLMIRSKGSVFMGESYQFIDAQVAEACPENCYYKLEEIDHRGKKSHYGPFMAAVKNKVEPSIVQVNSLSTYAVVPHEDPIAATPSPDIMTEEIKSGENRIGENVTTSLKKGYKDTISENGEEQLTLEASSTAYLDERMSDESIHIRIMDKKGSEVIINSLSEGVKGFDINSLETRRGKKEFILVWYASVPVKGFHVLRSTEKDGVYQRLTTAPIPYPGPVNKNITFRYTYIDTTFLEKEQVYYYRLETIPLEGSALQLSHITQSQ